MKKSLVLLALCAPTLGGCGAVTNLATQALVKKFAPTSSGSGPDATYITSLKPLDSGEGLIVFQPQTAPSSAKWADLGAGCSRYLQVHVAGQTALGKTPLWGSVDDASVRLKQPDLRPDAAKARQIGVAAGVTRVAVAQLSGNAARLYLKYQLLDVASGKVLATLESSAAPSQLPAQLPLLARQMSAKLGIARPVLPSRVALSSEELAFLGSQHWKLRHGDTVSAPVEARLKALASKDALAGIAAQRLCNYADDANWQKVGHDLLRNAPGNALVVGEVSWQDTGRFMAQPAQLDASAQKYPRNYLICTAKMRFERGSKARNLEVQWAENAVRATPRAAFAWTQLAQAHSNSASDIRRARFSNQISRAEWKRLNVFYARAHAAALQATKVDPADSHAWSELAETATFNDDYSGAQTALWKSIALNPGNSSAYSWGFEMCQPKWGGSAAQTLRIAQLAASNADKAYIDAHDLIDILRHTKQYAQAAPVLTTLLQKDPKNASALTELGAITHYNHSDYAKSEKLYRQALAIDPDDALANSQLGDLMFFVHNNPSAAEALYRKAIALKPRNGYFHANLARTLANVDRKPEAATEAQLAKSLGFSDQNHQVWSATGVSP